MDNTATTKMDEILDSLLNVSTERGTVIDNILCKIDLFIPLEVAKSSAGSMPVKEPTRKLEQIDAYLERARRHNELLEVAYKTLCKII